MDYNQLFEQIKAKKSFLCVGLDSDIAKIPPHLLQLEDPVFEFNKAVIDATAEVAIAYKPNIAFYESRGVEGWKSLEKTIHYIRTSYPDIFTIADPRRYILWLQKYSGYRRSENSMHRALAVPASGRRRLLSYFRFFANR